MRLQALDFIRGIAVILVLFRHGSIESFLQKIGWIGVDLFFVLSGFLVAGLVFREYKSEKKFNAKKFFIRRAFKIYPAFYIFLVISLAVNYFAHGFVYEARILLSEIFFLQSYLPHVWTHTWSIAVEEHFYLALALISAWRIKKLGINNQHRLIWYLVGAVMLILLMRVIVCYPKKHEEVFAFFSTHLRMDGIVIGVLIAYLAHFTDFSKQMKNRKYVLWITVLLTIWPPMFFDGGGFFMNTIGITIMNVGFGALVLLAYEFDMASVTKRLPWSQLVFGPVAFIGIHSYSIYLWHPLVLQELQRFEINGKTGLLVYLLSALAVGILFSYLIEKPFLVLRARYF